MKFKVNDYYLVDVREVYSYGEGYLIIQITGIINSRIHYRVIESNDDICKEHINYQSAFSESSNFAKACKKIDYPINSDKLLAYML